MDAELSVALNELDLSVREAAMADATTEKKVEHVNLLAGDFMADDTTEEKKGNPEHVNSAAGKLTLRMLQHGVVIYGPAGSEKQLSPKVCLRSWPRAASTRAR